MNNDDIGTEAQSLAGLVEYLEGSVVSRTLVNRPSGTVTLFAFDKEEGLSEHTAPFDAFVLTVEGNLEITIAEQRQRVGPGEVLLMPAKRPHALHAIERSKMLLIMVREAGE